MSDEEHSIRPPDAPETQKAPRRAGQLASTDDPLDHYVSLARSGGDISTCPTNLIPDLVHTLRARRDNEVATGRFNASEISDLAFRRAQDLQDTRRKTTAQRQRCGTFKRRLREAQHDYADLCARIAKLEQTLQEQLKSEREQLAERQAAEVEEVTAEWDKPEKARRYNRSSNMLRQLRTQAILLLNSHRYEEMRQVEKRADALQAREERQMQERMDNDEHVSYWINGTLAGADFVSLDSDHNFYWNENGELVIVFDKYEVAPGAMGTPEFAIGKDIIENIVKPEFADIIH